MQLWKKMKKNRKGFTLVEIIVVLVILAILAAFTIPAMLGFVNDARGKAYIAEAREIKVAYQSAVTEVAGSGVALSSDYTSSAQTTLGSVDNKAASYLTGDVTLSENTVKVTVNTTTAKVTNVQYLAGTDPKYLITIDDKGNTTVTKGGAIQ